MLAVRTNFRKAFIFFFFRWTTRKKTQNHAQEHQVMATPTMADSNNDLRNADGGASPSPITDTNTNSKKHRGLFRSRSLVGDHLLYSIPIQRQKWGDHQQHPAVNWGDIFFDLYFVAAAYNLSNIVRQSPTFEGLLYFVSCFGIVTELWWDKTYYDSRFFTRGDVFHRIYEVCVLVALGTTILHIRAANVLSHTTENIELFAFCVSFAIATVLTMLRYVEILWRIDGQQDVARITARRDIISKIPSLVLAVVAAIVAGNDYYNNNSSSGSAYGSNTGSTNGDGYSSDTSETGGRMLAGSDSTDDGNSPTNHIPIWLILGCWISWVGFILLRYSIMARNPNRKSLTIPINVDFTIHRYGEWVLLMLGSAILSMLIVEVSDSADYYATFFSGILSIVMLQFLHFRSQPQHADGHAMRRSVKAGLAYVVLLQIFSGSLLILGTSYKMLLYEYKYQDYGSYRNRRMLLEDMPRWLAGGDGALQFDTDDRRQRIAYFFCFSHALVWLCSDLMIVTHRGIKANLKRCKCRQSGTIRRKGLVMVFFRLALLVGILSVSVFRTGPLELALIGLAGTTLQIVLRIVMMAFAREGDRVGIHSGTEGPHDDKVEVEKETKVYSSGTAVEISQVVGANSTGTSGGNGKNEREVEELGREEA